MDVPDYSTPVSEIPNGIPFWAGGVPDLWERGWPGSPELVVPADKVLATRLSDGQVVLMNAAERVHPEPTARVVRG